MATVSLVVLFLLGLSLTGAVQQLIVSEPQIKINGMNPVENLLHRTPVTIAEFFADELMKRMVTIREHCEKMEMSEEKKFEGKLKEISEYQEEVNNLINYKYQDIPEEEKDAIKKGFEVAFKHLFDDEQQKEKMISLNCTQEFEAIMNQKMAEALQYAETLLNTSTTAFTSLINGVVKYSEEVEDALDQCLDLYPANDDNSYSLMKGSPSYECKQMEIQVLQQFVYEFIIRSTKLLSMGQDGEAVLNIFGPLPSNLPEVFPRPDVPAPEDPTIELVKPADEEEESVSDDDPPKPVTHHHGNNHNNHTHHGNHPSNQHEGTHHHENSHHDHTHHHHDNHPTNPPSSEGDSSPDSTTSDPLQQGHFDIVVEPEVSSNVHKEEGSAYHSHYILLVCGIISGMLFLLIVVTGVLILTVKRHRSRRKNWSQLTEEEKVSAMKQSGYINPTYEFFDKVTQ